jgi:CHAT domain-containing protein
VAEILLPEPVALAEAQAGLAKGDALILYQLTDTRLAAIVVTRERCDVEMIGPADPVGPAVEDALAAFAAGAGGEEPARRLHALLLRPLEERLAGARRLLISPDGPLAFLPFEALLDGEDRGGRRALERWEIAYAPSATVLAALRRDAAAARPGVGLVALGDPVYEGDGPAPLRGGTGRLERLPETGDEVRAIAAIFSADERTLLLREAATGARLREALAAGPRRLRALHFAGHARVDPVRPGLSGLVLSGGEMLRLDDLCELRAASELAVLSACETGRGRLQRGEGVLGLARSLFFSGVSRVVVSNWKVRDDATRALMVSFYAKMLRDGLPAGAALRAAKLELLRAGGAGAHPGAWASFVLWGLAD